MRGSEKDRRSTGEPASRSRDEGFRRGFAYGLTRTTCWILSILFFDFRIFGAHNVPRSGAVVLASTHQSFLDPWMLGMCPERKSCYLARASLFEIPFVGWLIRKYNAVPLPRESTAPRRALETGLKILEEGRSLIFFPEGTRTPDGGLQPLHRGIVLLARRSRAPIVPVLVRGAYRAFPRGRLLPRAARIEIRIGEPIIHEHDESSDSFILRLSECHRRLAIEAGAGELVGNDVLVGGGSKGMGESPPPSRIGGAEPPITAGASSSDARTTRSIDGSLAVAEA